MNKLLGAIASILFASTASAQANLSQIEGDWVTFKIEMRDGSRLYDRFAKEDSRYYVAFRGDKLFFAGEGVSLFRVDGNSLFTHGNDGYDVEKISKDTLVLCERFEKRTPDRMKRFYLVNRQVRWSQNESANAGRDTLRTNPDYAPKRNGHARIFPKEFPKLLTKSFEISGVIRLDVRNRKCTATVNRSTLDDQKLQSRVTGIVSGNFSDWDLSGLTQYSIIEIPFLAYAEVKGDFRSIYASYHAQQKAHKNSKTELQDMADSEAYANKGYSAFEKGKLEKAAEFFAKAFEKDPYNTDAIYNKITLNLRLGKKDEACNDLQALADLGQKPAIDLLQANCQ